MQGTSSQQKRCDDVPLILGIRRQSANWVGSAGGFLRVFDHKANQNSPKSTKKGGLPRPPQVRRIPVPKDNSIIEYHEELFVGTDT